MRGSDAGLPESAGACRESEIDCETHANLTRMADDRSGSARGIHRMPNISEGDLVTGSFAKTLGCPLKRYSETQC